MLILGGLDTDTAGAATRVDAALASGLALQTFSRMVEHQGGDPRIVDDVRRLPAAPHRELFCAWDQGYVTSMRAGPLGRASQALGAGRWTVGEAVDHGVGLRLLARCGDPVEKGQPLVELQHRDRRGLDAALQLCREAAAIGGSAPAVRPQLLGEVRGA